MDRSSGDSCTTDMFFLVALAKKESSSGALPVMDQLRRMSLCFISFCSDRSLMIVHPICRWGVSPSSKNGFDSRASNMSSWALWSALSRRSASIQAFWDSRAAIISLSLASTSS